MRTDTKALFDAGLELAVATWRDARLDFDWADVDWFVAHQTSVVHINAHGAGAGCRPDEFPLTLPTFGNIGPAAVPFTLAQHLAASAPACSVILLGIGSGLNTSYAETHLVIVAGERRARRSRAAGTRSGVVAVRHGARRDRAYPSAGTCWTTAARGVHGTMVCVHGNPTWSYLWRRFLAEAPPGWRVVAVDQLGMGCSERTGRPRRLAERIDDLDRVTAALDISGPVVLAAHDWGGAVALGWAGAHPDRLAGVVLANTGVPCRPAIGRPRLIRLARSAALRETVCVRTPAFVRGTAALSRPALPAGVRAGLRAPYATAEQRRAIGDFVADIPLEADHPSRSTLDGVVAGLERLADVPMLLIWGPRDPIFGEGFLGTC